MFEKLKDAYVKARYSKHYRISDEELAWLGDGSRSLEALFRRSAWSGFKCLSVALRPRRTSLFGEVTLPRMEMRLGARRDVCKSR